MTSGRVTVYFAALLARTEDGWEASDTELDDVETLSDLADLAREASPDEDTVLVKVRRLGEGNVCHMGTRTCFNRTL